MRRLCGLAPFAAALVLLVSGCGASRAPTSSNPEPGPSSGAAELALDPDQPALGCGPRAFFPNQIGNTWRYAHRFSVTTIYDDPARPPSTYSQNSDVTGTMVCRETHAGRDYVVERRVRIAGTQTYCYWIQHRQDPAGLYEWDYTGAPACDSGKVALRRINPTAEPEAAPWAAIAASLGVPEGSASWRAAWEGLGAKRATVGEMARARFRSRPGGVEPGEIQRLRYPLFRGQSWTLRAVPVRFWMEVEGAEMLRTPAGRFPAWRIRIHIDSLGPEDVVRVWYGRAGYLGYEAHLVSVATDPFGHRLGTLVGGESDTLTEIALVQRWMANAP